MKVNMQMPNNYEELVDTLRKNYYPNSSAKEYRSSYICNQMIDSFDINNINQLNAFVESDGSFEKTPKTITFRQHTYDKLTLIAQKLSASPAKALRCLLLFTSSQNNTNSVSARETFLQLKIAQLEQELECATRTLLEIKGYLKHEEV